MAANMFDWSKGYQGNLQDMVLGPDGQPQVIGGMVRDKWGRSFPVNGGSGSGVTGGVTGGVPPREQSMASFISNMTNPQAASPDGPPSAMQDQFSGQVRDFGAAVNAQANDRTNPFSGQVAGYGDAVNAQMNSPQAQLQQATMNTENSYGAAPVLDQATLDTGNRFEQGLTEAEGGLNRNRFDKGLSDSEGRLSALLSDPDSLNLSAAYKFRVKQGEEALQRSLGARGLLNSGNRLKALADYGQEAGSQEYEAEFGRRKGMYDTNAGLWGADKNANLARYNAVSGNWNADKSANTARYGVEQGANVAGFNARSDAWNADKAANTSRYGVEQGANVAGYNAQTNAANDRMGTLGQLLQGANTAYGNAANANTARLGALGDLMRGAGANYNQGAATNATDRANWGNIWSRMNPTNTNSTTTSGNIVGTLPGYPMGSSGGAYKDPFATPEWLDYEKRKKNMTSGNVWDRPTNAGTYGY